MIVPSLSSSRLNGSLPEQMPADGRYSFIDPENNEVLFTARIKKLNCLERIWNNVLRLFKKNRWEVWGENYLNANSFAERAFLSRDKVRDMAAKKKLSLLVRSSVARHRLALQLYGSNTKENVRSIKIVQNRCLREQQRLAGLQCSKYEVCSTFTMQIGEKKCRLLVPKSGSGYLLGDEIGRGTWSTVYVALDLFKGGRVAVLTKATNQPEQVQSFFSEASLLRSFRNKRGLVQMRKVFYTIPSKKGVQQYIVEKLYPGGSLERYFGRLNDKQKHLISLDLIQALLELHSRCLIHSDLKPENVYLGYYSENNPIPAVLADFNLTHKADEIKDWGTPARMSPAHLSAFIKHHKRTNSEKYADELFELGLILLQVETGDGKHPFPPWRDDLINILKLLNTYMKQPDPAVLQKIADDALPKMEQAIQKFCEDFSLKAGGPRREIHKIIAKMLNVNWQNRPSLNKVLQVYQESSAADKIK